MSGTPDIHLYTASTMNGWKVTMYLEEAGIPYDVTPIDFGKKDQKSDWFLAMNPNGRSPVMVDRGNDDFVVFESGAMIWYLAEKYGTFLPRTEKEKSEALQWIMWQMSALGPMMGQAMYFNRIAQGQGVDDKFATQRYEAESRRLLEVLDKQIGEKPYAMGEEFGLVDIATYPWARSYYWANVPVEGLENLQRWFDLIDARPATQKAITIPKAYPEYFGKGNVAEIVKEDSEHFAHDVSKA